MRFSTHPRFPASPLQDKDADMVAQDVIEGRGR